MPELSLTTSASAAPLAAPSKSLGPLFLYAAVESRRNRVLYRGWPAIILGTLPFAGALAAAMDIPAAQAVSGAVAAWAVAGLPLTAVLFGAVAGAGLRGAEEADAALPLSPRQRAFGALAAAGRAFLGNAALVGALLAVAFKDAVSVLAGLTLLGGLAPSAGYAAAVAVIAASAAGWLMTASFAVAYAASHAVLGGVAALAGGALLLLPVVAGALLHINHAPQAAGPFLAAAAASTAVSAAAALFSLGRSAPAAARSSRLSWAAAAALCLLPLSGALGGWAALRWSGTAVAERLEPAWLPWGYSSQDDVRERPPTGLLAGPGGRLVRRTEDGDAVLIDGSVPSVGELVRRGSDGFDRVVHAFIDDSGRVWAEVRSARQDGQPSVKTVWTGPPGGRLTRLATLPYDMELRIKDGRAVVDRNIYAYEDDDWVPLDPAKPPRLKRQ